MARFLAPETLLKAALPAALVLGAAAGVLAQESSNAALPAPSYVVQAGGFAPANADLLTFFPQNLQVHRGDSITWTILGFHNVHFEEGPSQLIIVDEVDGQQMPVGNPAVVFPSVESGSSFTGGDVNSGLPVPPNAPVPFTLTIDAEPGTYNYFCDVHPGMAGSIVVVDDGAAIPGPVETQLQAQAEIGAAIGRAMAQYGEAKQSYPMMPETGQEARVLAGIGSEVSNQVFVPESVVIPVGGTVSWALQEDTREIHTVTWPPFGPGQEFMPQEQEGGPPLLVIGPVLTPSVENGASIGQGDAFNYVVTPGETFSLTFTEPGAYPYLCSLHAGMTGTVIVLPESST